MAQNEIKILKQNLEYKIKIGEADEKELKSIGEKIAKQQKLAESLNERIKASENLQNITSQTISIMTGMDDKWKSTFVGSFIQSLSTATTLKQVIGDVGSGLSHSLKFANLLGASIMKSVESTLYMAYAQDEATAAFSKATSTGTQYHSMITGISQGNRQFGISADDSARSVQALYTGFNMFSAMAPKVQKELATTTAHLDALGISADTTTKNIETAMRFLGMSAKQAGSLQVELLATAEALSLAPKTVAEGFAKASPMLIAHGAKMEAVFKRMAEQTKTTGLEIDKLLGFARQFDTYEGSARVVADFNHILGGPFLNSMELLNATESERIDIMKDAFKMSGQSFDQMDEHTQRALAHHLGLQDVAEMQKLMMPLTREQIKIDKEKAISDAALAERAKTAQSMLEQMKNAALSLAIGIQPLIKGISTVVGWITLLNDKTKKTVAGFEFSLIPAIVVAVATLKILGLSLRLITGAKIAMAGATAGATIAERAFNLVKRVGAILLGINTAAATKESAAKVVQTTATNAQTVAQVKANATAKGGIKTMLAFAGAIALIGLGVGVAAAGIGRMADGFSKLSNDQMLGVIVVLGGMALAIGALGLLMLNPVGLAAAAGMLAIGAAVMMMGSGMALATLGIAALVSAVSNLDFSNLFDGISKESVKDITLIANQVARITSSINGMSISKAEMFDNIMSKVAPTIVSMTSKGDSDVGRAVTDKMIQTTSREASRGDNNRNDKRETQLQPITISVKIDEKEIGKISWEVLKKELERVGGRRIQGPRIN